MLEFYFENNKKIYKKFKKSISEESDQQVGKKRSDKEKKKNDDSDSEQEQRAPIPRSKIAAEMLINNFDPK